MSEAVKNDLDKAIEATELAQQLLYTNLSEGGWKNINEQQLARLRVAGASIMASFDATLHSRQAEGSSLDFDKIEDGIKRFAVQQHINNQAAKQQLAA
jgi:hypothetical protein